MDPTVIVALVMSAGSVVVALITTQGNRGMRREVREVHASTVNSHGTDLRHDVDKVLKAVARIPVLEVRLADHLAESATYRRETAKSLRDLAETQGEQSQAIGHLAEALPVVARATPAPVDTEEV